MLSALCSPYHVSGWLSYTDYICKIFYVQIIFYHHPILNVIYHKTMYFIYFIITIFLNVIKLCIFAYFIHSLTWISRWSISTASSSSPPSLSALRSLASTMLGVSAGTHRQWARKRQFPKEREKTTKKLAGVCRKTWHLDIAAGNLCAFRGSCIQRSETLPHQLRTQVQYSFPF